MRSTLDHRPPPNKHQGAFACVLRLLDTPKRVTLRRLNITLRIWPSGQAVSWSWGLTFQDAEAGSTISYSLIWPLLLYFIHFGSGLKKDDQHSIIALQY